MRDIGFRGKALDDGEWAEGFYVATKDAHYICYDNQYNDDLFLSPKNIMIEIDPATVGQFTGEYERLGHKGKKIYENDIVEISTLGINYEGKTIRGVVKLVDGCFEVEFSQPVYDIHDKCYRNRLYVKCFVVNSAIKVIGNVSDLLKEAEHVS